MLLLLVPLLSDLVTLVWFGLVSFCLGFSGCCQEVTTVFFKEEPPGLRLVMLVSLKFLLFDQCVV